MTPPAFTALFLAFLGVSTGLRIWLARRHLKHIRAHRGAVPAAFADRITLAEHQKAADYSTAKLHLGLLSLVAEVTLLIGLTLGGVMQVVFNAAATVFAAGTLMHGLVFFAGLGIISFVVDLPFSLYRTFDLEARFGFNQMTLKLWLIDLVKSTVLGVLVATPLLLAVLWLITAMGERWWLYVWGLWLGFNLLVLLIYPTVIAPLFNKFSPLDDAALKQRIETLLTRCGFTVSGLFVMDGSKRSAHGNAYFTGFGAAKRIVFFDTLLARLSPPEIEAVLAHELGHFKHGHVWKRLGMMAATSLALLWLLGAVMQQPWFYEGLGVNIAGVAPALALFFLVLSVFTFPLTPVMSALSRKHEYEADSYAAKQTDANDLVSALVKLYRDNAATLTPDPLHSLFYDSHPPALLRIAHLQSAKV